MSWRLITYHKKASKILPAGKITMESQTKSLQVQIKITVSNQNASNLARTDIKLSRSRYVCTVEYIPCGILHNETTTRMIAKVVTNIIT